MRKILLALLIGLCAECLIPASQVNALPNQQELVVLGKVRVFGMLHGVTLDESGEPIEGVEVAVLEDADKPGSGQPESLVAWRVVASALTNKKGTFRFKNLAAGKYVVRFRAAGFNEFRLPVRFKPSDRSAKGIRIHLQLAN